MEQQKTLADLLATADDAAHRLDQMGPMMQAFGDIELLVSFEDLATQTTSVVDGSLGGYLTALRA